MHIYIYIYIYWLSDTLDVRSTLGQRALHCYSNKPVCKSVRPERYNQKFGDRCQRACIHRNLLLNIIVKLMINPPATTDDIDKDMAHERVPRRITVPRRVPGTLTMSPSWYVAPHNFYGPYKYDRRHDIHMQDHGQSNSWTVRSQSGLSQVPVRSTVRSQSGLVNTEEISHSDYFREEQ